MKINEIVRPQHRIDEGLGNILKTIGQKVAPGAAQRVAAGSNVIGQTASYLKGGLKASATAALDALGAASLFFIAKPIWDYESMMSDTKDQLESGKISQEKYNEIHEFLLGEVILKITAGFTGKFFLKSIPAFLGFLKYIPGIGGALSMVVAGLTEAAGVYFLQKLASPEGRVMLAKLTSVGFIEGTGAYGDDAYNSLKNIVKESIGLAQSEEPQGIEHDKPAALLDPNNPTATTDPAKSTTPAVTDQNNKPKDAAQNDKSTDTAQDPDVYTPSNMRRDANGNLLLKYAD